MAEPIVFNSTNFISQNVFRVRLPSTVNLSDYVANVDNCILYYSWYNITAALNNNVFQLTIPTATPATYTITLPDGAYNISTLNDYLQYWFVQNGFYITNNTTGVNTYYAAFVVSPQSYQVQFITTALPTSTPSGYTAGSGLSDKWPASSNQSMQLIVPSTNSFKSIIGFAAGTYPASPTITGTTYTASSTVVPNVNPIYGVQLRLNCLYNSLSSNSQLLYTFTNNGVGIGALIDASPNFYQPVPCSGSFSEIVLSLFDQNGNPLALIDPNVMIKISFRKRP